MTSHQSVWGGDIPELMGLMPSCLVGVITSCFKDIKVGEGFNGDITSRDLIIGDGWGICHHIMSMVIL